LAVKEIGILFYLHIYGKEVPKRTGETHLMFVLNGNCAFDWYN